MIDSFMCCIELFKITQNPEYIAMAHKIYFNAISHSQLANGGFGLERAVITNENPCFTKNPDHTVTEAFWCCTMHGADGLSYVSQNQCICANGEFVFLNYFDSEVYEHGITITVKSQYPLEGRVKFKISGIQEQSIKLKLFIPDYAEQGIIVFADSRRNMLPENGFVQLELNGDCEFMLVFDIPIMEAECIAPTLCDRFYKKMHGYLLLGTKDNEDREFVYLNRTIFNDAFYAQNEDIKILFAKNEEAEYEKCT